MWLLSVDYQDGLKLYVFQNVKLKNSFIMTNPK